MSTERRPTLVVHYDHDGNAEYMMSEGVDLYIVDDRCPGDRVYKYTTPSFDQEISDMIGPAEMVGHLYDHQ